MRSYTCRQVGSVLDAKVADQEDPLCGWRSSGEVNFWVIINGQKQFRVTRPQGHSKPVSSGTLKSIINRLRLDQNQFDELVRCPMSRSDYYELLRRKLA